jgi:hypothetical protein
MTEKMKYKRYYDWIKEQISLEHPPGCSMNKLVEIALQSRREEKTGYDEEKKAPGKHKLREIVKAGNGIDWKYTESKGGRGIHEPIIPITPDSGIEFEKQLHMVKFSMISNSIKKLNLKKKSKFLIEDFIEFEKIRNQLLAYPMTVYYYNNNKYQDKDRLFESIVILVRDQMKILIKIEKAQLKINKEAKEIFDNITRLNHIDLNRVVLIPAIKNKKKAVLLDENFEIGEFFPIRNALNRLKSKKPSQ